MGAVFLSVVGCARVVWRLLTFALDFFAREALAFYAGNVFEHPTAQVVAHTVVVGRHVEMIARCALCA
jgi:hypothetical protein